MKSDHVWSRYLPNLLDYSLVKKGLRLADKLFTNFENIPVNVGGHLMWAPSFDRWLALILWKYSLLERYEKSILKSVVRKNMTALDIGANVGFYTLNFASWVGAEGKVFSFEPDPDNFKALQKNARENRFGNVTLFQEAVADKAGEALLYLNESHRGDHRLFPFESSSGTISIKKNSIDHYFGDGARVDVVKIDVQGAEPLVLKGMERTIARNPNIFILCELAPVFIEQSGLSMADYVDFLKGTGLSMGIIDPGNGRVEMITHDVFKSRFLKYPDVITSMVLSSREMIESL